MRVSAHAAAARGREGGDELHRRTVGVKELLRLIRAQPRLQLGEVPVSVCPHGDRHLMGSPAVLHRQPVHLLGAGPTLGGAQHDHGPAGPLGLAGLAGLPLDALDLPDHPVQHRRHLLVHDHGIVALHKVRLPAAATEEALHLLVTHAGEDGRIGDLEAVEVQNGQHSAVGDGVDKLVAVPRGGQRAGLRLAVAHHTGGDQVGVIRHGAEGVGQRVAQLAALMDRAGGLRCHMAGNAAGEGETLEELLHPLLVSGDVGIDLGIAAVQPVLRHHGVAAVAGAGEIDHIQIVALDDPVQMGIDEVLAGAGPPVSHDGLLEVAFDQRALQEGVIHQIQLAGRQIVGSPPVGVKLPQLLLAQRLLFGEADAGFDGRHGKSSLLKISFTVKVFSVAEMLLAAGAVKRSQQSLPRSGRFLTRTGHFSHPSLTGILSCKCPFLVPQSVSTP